MKCLCGKEATHTAYLPMPNVYAGLKQVNEPHPVCDYHADKARQRGYVVEEGAKGEERVVYDKHGNQPKKLCQTCGVNEANAGGVECFDCAMTRITTKGVNPMR